jgi:hypothetical protein
MLELTTTRRRTPLAETTFVKRVPNYIQTYLGSYSPGMRRSGRDFRPYGLGKPEVRAVPPYIKTYLGETGVRRTPPWIQTYLGGYDGSREMMGFGALDASSPTSQIQGNLRKAGYCQVGRVDNRWGPRTAGALARFAMEHARRGSAGAYVAGVDWVAENGSGTVRLDSGLLGKLRFAAAGQRDECAMEPTSSGGGGGGSTYPEDEGGAGATQAGVFSNPMLWLGLAAAAGVFWYVSQEDQGEMMLMPPDDDFMGW